VAPGGCLGVEAGRAVAPAEDAAGPVFVGQGEQAPVLLHAQQRSAKEARPSADGTPSRPPSMLSGSRPQRRGKSVLQQHRDRPACSSNGFGLEDDRRDVVVKLVPGEVPDGVEQGVEDGLGRLPLVRPNDTERALQPELPPIR